VTTSASINQQWSDGLPTEARFLSNEHAERTLRFGMTAPIEIIIGVTAPDGDQVTIALKHPDTGAVRTITVPGHEGVVLGLPEPGSADATAERSALTSISHVKALMTQAADLWPDYALTRDIPDPDTYLCVAVTSNEAIFTADLPGTNGPITKRMGLWVLGRGTELRAGAAYLRSAHAAEETSRLAQEAAQRDANDVAAYLRIQARLDAGELLAHIQGTDVQG
jgi:hypothetical protein